MWQIWKISVLAIAPANIFSKFCHLRRRNGPYLKLWSHKIIFSTSITPGPSDIWQQIFRHRFYIWTWCPTSRSEIGSPPYRNSSARHQWRYKFTPNENWEQSTFSSPEPFFLCYLRPCFFLDKLLQSNNFDKSIATYIYPISIPSLKNVYIPKKKGKL